MTKPPFHAGRISLRLASDPQAVRDALRHLLDAPPLSVMSDDLRGSAEIVLAEVLNNIVEHAYAGSAGPIDVTVVHEHAALSFQIIDFGCMMPWSALPAGTLADAGDGDLPEGGFGWFLIRSLTQDLAYTRSPGRNTLVFRMAAD